MTSRIPAIVVVVGLFASLPARADFHEFTLTGQVTQASFWPNVAVGDPFTIKYVAETSDQDPSAILGRYNSSDALVTLPNTTITSEGGVARVRVLLDTPTMTQRVVFESLSPNYQFTIDFIFPGGTLTTDELPLTLPLTSATTSMWHVYNFGPQVRGDFTSYSSTPVPEPAAAAGVALSVMFMRRRRRGAGE